MSVLLSATEGDLRVSVIAIPAVHSVIDIKALKPIVMDLLPGPYFSSHLSPHLVLGNPPLIYVQLKFRGSSTWTWIYSSRGT
jgi:hypothetical protein